MKLGSTLRALRRKKGWTQRALAARARITHVYVTLLENGKKTNPSLTVLTRLARALGVSVADLLDRR